MRKVYSFAFLLLSRLADHGESFVHPTATFSKDTKSAIVAYGKNNDIQNEDNSSFLASLKARQEELMYENYLREQSWRNADCQSKIKFALKNDWIRRLDVEYPFVVCGSTSGNISVFHAETGDLVASTSAETPSDQRDPGQEELQLADVCISVERVRQLMHYGSGRVGTLAIAFKGDLICVSNPLDPNSGVQVHRFVDQQLLFQGNILGLDGKIVTCLKITEDHLWVGTSKGMVQAYSTRNTNLPLSLQHSPKMEWKFTDSILSLEVEPEIGLGVVTTASGSVDLISLSNQRKTKGLKPICSLYPPLNAKEHVMTAILARTSEVNNQYSIVCGGGDGSIWIQPLNMEDDEEEGEAVISKDQPFQDPLTQLRPPHLGPVKTLGNPLPGILVSGGLDGSLRVWDIDKENASLYQFVGYKIWMGSIWTDGLRLITDGSDNSVIVHDFDKEDNESEI